MGFDWWSRRNGIERKGSCHVTTRAMEIENRIRFSCSWISDRVRGYLEIPLCRWDRWRRCFPIIIFSFYTRFGDALIIRRIYDREKESE